MPLLKSNYRPHLRIFRNGDFSTIYAATLRKVHNIEQTRERLELLDGDFMDVEWSFSSKKTATCVIIFHGLEGHAKRPYVLGTAKIFNQNNADACAVYFRSCSGESNRIFSSYHSGRIEDVQAVIELVLSKSKYSNIILKGFSLGGNLTLKYLGCHQNIPKEVKLAVAVSTPVDLESCMWRLHRPRNFIYATDFLMTLKKKLNEKAVMFPDRINRTAIKEIKTLRAYDDFYTSKANGYKDALDYYRKCSCKPNLEDIKIPTLIINAKNDPFLPEACYPIEAAKNSSHIYLDLPDYGGHVGFVDRQNIYYNEKRAIEFVKNMI